MLVILSILFIFLIFFVIRPAIVGYTTYQKVKDSNSSIEDYGKDIQELESRLLVSDTKLTTYSEFNKDILNNLDIFLDKFSNCKNELSDLKTEFDLSKEEYEEFRKEYDNLEKEYKEFREEYDLLVKDFANNLCCKAKVDNFNIDSYKVEDNKIVCLEEGELKIECKY